MIASLASQISIIEDIKCINPLYKEDIIPAALLALHLNLPLHSSVDVGKNRQCLSFSTYSEEIIDVCLFKRNYFADYAPHHVKYYLETLEDDDTGNFPKIIMPWKK